MDAQSADFTIFECTLEVRMGGVGRVERDTVILNGDLQNTVLIYTIDVHMVFVAIFEAVTDDIREQFIQRQVDFKRLAFGNAAGLTQRAEMFAKGIQLRQIVF